MFDHRSYTHKLSKLMFFFSGFNFTTAQVVCITAMIDHVFSTVQIYDLSYIHLDSSPSTGILRTHNVTSSRWLDSSVGRALHRFRRGHGLNPVQACFFFF